MNQSFTDYLKNEFINGSMVKKDNFEELWEVWREELDDDELNKFANEWKLTTAIEKNDYQMKELVNAEKLFKDLTDKLKSLTPNQ